MSLPRGQSARPGNVTAVLGPTNTGKTHLAIERMLGHESGMIGLPLRLLAREVYDRIVGRVGAPAVALITGEEKIKPPSPRYYVATVEAMPTGLDVAFLAIDEIQIAADLERGHVFTDRLLHARGSQETLLLGASTMRDPVRDILPSANLISRPRLSKLTYAGQKKISRLPRRSAVVAFSANEVYAIAELIRRQRGGAAVVLGALSPRTRNAQVELYQNGEVDFLVATDAIGMGLNLDVDHVAFAGSRKFDGQNHRELTPSEIAQIAGRAGRHINDGTFGVSGTVAPFDSDLVNRLEAHEFEQVKTLQWRNRELDYASLDSLQDSLRAVPDGNRLARARQSDDAAALEAMANDTEIKAMAVSPAAVKRLWEVCQMPDYRKISAQAHAELIAALYKPLMGDPGTIPEDWFAEQVSWADRTDGDIDTIANRIAHIRTWTFVSHRPDWLADHTHWQERTREIEDRLSDALHENLTQRFVDRRTSTLIKSMRDKENLFAEIGKDGEVHVERHFVGRLAGFVFTPDPKAEGLQGKAARHAAAQILVHELTERSARLVAASDEALSLTAAGRILWEGSEVAILEAGERPLAPNIALIADEHLTAPDRERILARLGKWLTTHIESRIKPLVDLATAEDVQGLARGVAFQLVESFGVLKRETVAEEIRALDQDARGQLRKYGVRFGAFNIYIPVLLKPAPVELMLLLWALATGKETGLTPDAIPEPPRQGLTSAANDPLLSDAYYRVSGFHRCGNRVVRIDMLERLADMIRPLVSWRANRATPDTKAPAANAEDAKAPAASTPDTQAKEASKEPTPAQPQPAPEGATGDGGFRVQPDMMSIVGCSGEDFASVLRTLGFRSEQKHVPVAAPDDTPETSAETVQVESASDDKTPAAAEPAIDEIWRPKKRRPAQQRPDTRRSNERQGRHSRKDGGKKGRPPRRSGPSRGKGRPKSREKDKIDPDSPFAALQKLKQDLESGVREDA